MQTLFEPSLKKLLSAKETLDLFYHIYIGDLGLLLSMIDL
jgi:hypothetical protein